MLVLLKLTAQQHWKKLSMSRTEAQKKADKKYENKVARIVIKFNPDDEEDFKRLAWLNKSDNKTALIKQLIDKAIENGS